MGNYFIQNPFEGSGEVIVFPAEVLMENLNRSVLYRSRWKLKNDGEQFLSHMLSDKKFLSAIEPRAVYGYFPASRIRSGLNINDTSGGDFRGDGASRREKYFCSEKEDKNILPLMAVTIGKKAVELSGRLYKNYDYAEYFLFHGLAAELTETFCRLIHLRIDRESDIKNSRRRSFGHPGCPGLQHQREILNLLDAERIALSVSPEGQLIPEFSSTAFIAPADR